MRIEINAGGLQGSATLSTFEENLASKLQQSEVCINGWNAIRSSAYSMNGGVGCLQSAVDGLEARKTIEEANRDRLLDVQKQYQEFVEHTKQTDQAVADLVAVHQDEFYQANPWAKPTVAVDPTALAETVGGCVIGSYRPSLINDVDVFKELAKLVECPNVVPNDVLGAMKDFLEDEDGSSAFQGKHADTTYILQKLGPDGVLKYFNAETIGTSGFALGTLGLLGFNSIKSKDGSITPEKEGASAKNSENSSSISFSSETADTSSSVSAGRNVSILGMDTDVNFNAKGETFSHTSNYSTTSSLDWENGEVGAEAKGETEWHVLDGNVSGNVGLSSFDASGSVVNVELKGDAGISLFEDGKLNPSVKLNGSASVSVVEGDFSTQFGTEDYNVHANAKGSILTADAKVDLEISNDRVAAEVGAEAYLAEGKVTGGFTIFGIDVDLSVSGKIGGAGAKAGGHASSTEFGGDLDFGLGAGVGVSFNVDFSDFEMPDINLSDTWDSVQETVTNTWDNVQETVTNTWDNVQETASNTWNTVQETARNSVIGKLFNW